MPLGPVKWPVELLDDAQYRARGFLAPDGMPALPVGWDGQRLTLEGTAPMPGDAALPLAGIRVVDLGWITAGAASSTLLLDLGADVVKVEGPGAPDPFRRWDGAEPGSDWWNRSPFSISPIAASTRSAST
ncbi:CoA transferase [Siccirubricoccus deserti]